MKIRISFFILVLFLFASNMAQSNDTKTDNIVGVNYIMHSKILAEKRELQVYLPDNYSVSNSKNYPVLYILDGQRLYLYGASLLQSFSQFKLTPEFIVVGIKNSYPRRFGLFLDTTQFLEFLEHEVIPLIDKEYRTSKERLLFGWEYGGGFAIQALLDKPNLFDAYLAASPFPLNAPDLPIKDKRLKSMSKAIANKQDLDTFLYFAVGESEGMVKEGSDQLSALLTKNAPQDFNWKYQILQGEEHRSTPYDTLYHGLKAYYLNYPALQFKSIEMFKKFGGLEKVNEYYLERDKKYGESSNQKNSTQWNLVRRAMDEKNYSLFKMFMDKFKADKFIERQRSSWASRFAQFYLENNNPDEAIVIYHSIIDKSPSSPLAYNQIGHVFESKGDLKEAKTYYQKAVDLAKRNSAPQLAEFETDLASLTK